MPILPGTPEFYAARCGSIGASDMPRVVRRIKSGSFSADRAQLLAEKAIERLTGQPFIGFKSAAMVRGQETEAEARLTYELIRGVEVEPLGVVPHPGIQGAHASPDGGVGVDGLVEIKCPLPAAHLETLLNDVIEPDYIVQVGWQLACTGRRWCDLISYHPGFPTMMQLWIRRVYFNQSYVTDLEREARRFIGDLEDRLGHLSRRYASRLAA